MNGDGLRDAVLGLANRAGCCEECLAKIRAALRPPEGSGLHPRNTSFTVLGKCDACVHRYEYAPASQMDLCDAYPSAPGIPRKILYGEHDHLTPYGGEALDENGDPILFEPHVPFQPPRPGPGPCPCECNDGGFCGGCGHAGCGGRRPAVRMVGEDGNSFAILARCVVAARRADWPEDRIKRFMRRATAGDYDHLLRFVMQEFDVDEGEDE